MAKKNRRRHTNGRKASRIHREANQKAYVAPYKVFNKVQPVPNSSLHLQAASVAWVAEYESKSKVARKK